ncbi:MAG TPA: DUF4395 domain-containing protein [Acidimicrobiales bacterium]|nr:DUF4395 domain-containing protein [Acidimicrobiales bacterium]
MTSTTAARSLFGFPDPVNDLAARVVAAGVVAMSVAAITWREQWLLIPIAYGFWARVLTGPKLSPLGRVATVLVAPRLGRARPVPGPPKRFAQGIGVAFSTAALLLWFAFSLHSVAWVVLGLLATAASLEAFLGYCLGCRVFALLMKLGVLPESACLECADLSRRHPQLTRPL